MKNEHIKTEANGSKGNFYKKIKWNNNNTNKILDGLAFPFHFAILGILTHLS